jgi:CcdB protein
MPGAAGRLTPVARVSGVEHILLVPRMTQVSAADLRETKDQLVSYRNEIVAALDFPFLGV